MSTHSDEIATGPSVFGSTSVKASSPKENNDQTLQYQIKQISFGVVCEGTLRAYRSAWGQYSAWCKNRSFDPLNSDASVVSLYISSASGRLAPSTLRAHLSAIAAAYRIVGRPIDVRHPQIRAAASACAESTAHSPSRRAKEILPETLQQMLNSQPNGVLGIRNRAMLLICYGAALRRSELVALNIGDVQEVPKRGLLVRVRSNADRHSYGDVAILSAGEPHFCPIHAWRAWIEKRNAGSDHQPLFCGLLKNGRLTERRLSGKALERLVHDAAIAISPSEVHRYTPHSLRAGLTLTAINQQEHLDDIARQTRHRYLDLHRHPNPRDLWENNVTKQIFNRLSDGQNGVGV